jgi:hypothetical protein
MVNGDTLNEDINMKNLELKFESKLNDKDSIISLIDEL